jgi:hypothetical protein
VAEPDSKAAHRAQPISRHPLFPPIVGLWFAVLVGLGSFAVHRSVLESLVLAGHVDILIPAATPPLGMTARLLLALVVGTLGGALGWAIAARMAAREAAAAPQVLNVAEFAGDEPLPWPGMAGAAPSGERPSVAPAPAEPAPPLTAAERIATAALGELSHVELVERLAIAIRRRHERIASGGDIAAAGPVVRFPGLADRLGARHPLPEPAPAPAPHETEKALRGALATLQRMSGGA